MIVIGLIALVAACAALVMAWRTRKDVESLDRLWERQLGVNEVVDAKFVKVDKRIDKVGMKIELRKDAVIDLKKRCDGITVRLDGVTKRDARIESALKDEQKRGDLLTDIVTDLVKNAAKDGCDNNTEGDE